jgi:mycofactocin system glycosyltransferase
MMPMLPPGHYVLLPGIALVPQTKGGIILQETPFRVFRVNETAFAILTACRQGFSLQEYVDHDARQTASLLALLDSLCRWRILEWRPSSQGFAPPVSIVIPVYNRPQEISECLEALLHLDYPADRREIIVVDDGSTDQTREVVGQYPVKLITREANQGQSAARNLGVQHARGEIIAFIDSDCVAEPEWLTELVPYFQDQRLGLVGGFVASYFQKTRLDRYESAASPLNMGRSLVIADPSDLDFYVPTCNLLVRQEAYLKVGGLDETRRFGEDVDLCWKLRKHGYRQTYVPAGPVRHKHRSRLLNSGIQRFHYGTSEPELYASHPEVKKRLPWQLLGLLFWIAIALGFFWQKAFLLLAPATWIGDFWAKKRAFPTASNKFLQIKILKALFKSYFSLAYYLTLHSIRYYLFLLILLSFIFPAILPLTLTMVILPVTVEFFRKQPSLNFCVFALFFLGEQLCYQAGVLYGAIRIGNFRCYRPHLMRASRMLRKSRPSEINGASLGNLGGKEAEAKVDPWRIWPISTGNCSRT